MHELGLIEEIVRLGESELERAGATGPVEKIVLRVGKLSGASPEALHGAFAIVAPTTRFSGAVLEIEEPRPVCSCLGCGVEQEVDGYTFACPSCGNSMIQLRGGSELQMVSIDVAGDGE